MPIVTLRYKLPEEEEEFKLAKNGTSYMLALSAVADALRSKYKYGEVQETTWEEVRQLFYDTISEKYPEVLGDL